MRTSRPVCAAAAAAALATSLTACGRTGWGSSGTDGDTLRITANSTDRTAMETVMAVFEREHPDAKVTVTYADADELQKTLPADLASGTGPDVFTVWPGSGNPGALRVLQSGGYLADLSGLDFADRIPKGARSVTEVDGKTYIVPANYSGIGAIYSREAMDAISGSEPRTWDELLALCDKAASQGKVLFSLGIETPWVTQLADYALAATTVYAERPDFAASMDDGLATFAGSGWRQALKKYRQLDEHGCFNRDSLNTSYEASVKAVATGKAVGFIQVASSLSAVKAKNPELRLGMFALPATDNAAQTRMPGAVSAAYGVNDKSGSRDLALEFAAFLGSDSGQNLYNKDGGTLPAIPNDRFEIEPALNELVERQKDGTTVPFMDQLWPDPQVQQTHFEQIQALFAERTDIDGVLTALDEVYREK